MSSWGGLEDSSAAPVGLTAPDVQAGDVLHSSSSKYKVLEFIGEGLFGKVTSSINLRTEEKVAVKILKNYPEFAEDNKQEVAILSLISCLDAGCTNMVRFYEQFQYMEQTCMVFEKLDLSLYDFMEQREWKALSLNEIRPVAKQLLVTLDALKYLGVLHTDIKPDNIMFVNMQDQPLKLKLIDFGCAMLASQVKVGMVVQPFGYMAPEISLGLPFSEAIDVWGVGCVLAFLYIAENLFHTDCKYQMMKSMVRLLGQPQDKLLRAGKYSWQFFIEEEGEDASSWRLLTAEEFTAVNNMETEKDAELPSSLSGLIPINSELEATEIEEHLEFVSLLEGLLHLDGDERLSPRQALQKPFISMREDIDSRDYPTTDQKTVCTTVHCPTPDSGYGMVSWDTVDDLYSACVTMPATGSSELTVLSNPRSVSTDLSTKSLLSVDTSKVSWCSDENVDVTSATVYVGGKRKLLRTTGKFFSSLMSCCRPKVED